MIDLSLIERTTRVITTSVQVALFRHDTLLAGPYTGEFGIEVLDWSGYVRRLGSKYRRTIAISYPGNECLYDGCEYYSHEKILGDSGYGFGSLLKSEARAIANQLASRLGVKHFDWLHPYHLNKVTRRRIGPQLYPEPFQIGHRDYQYDVAFHFRNMLRADLDVKNYPVEYAETLARKCRSAGLRSCCIGHPKYSLLPDGCDDMRSTDLGETLRCLSGTKALVGGSSGPMHFASLYGVPIVVWVDGRIAEHTRVLEVYRGSGNPHKSPVYFVSDTSFQPTPEQVFSRIGQALSSIDRS
jgi:hypothetical protein